ncbi:hypothetical protein KA977_10210 [Candidatus Dependentiae bacterium]|nr:hypothetical protein [Candidatus Dependentiae bacterium]
MKKYYLIIIIFILCGGLFGNFLSINFRKMGKSGYQFISAGIKNNHLDAIDMIYILSNRQRFKADINWINFVQCIEQEDEHREKMSIKYLLKTVYTDPFFRDAQLYGTMIYTFSSNKSEFVIKEILKLSDKIDANSVYTKQIAFIYLLNNKDITLPEILNIEKELLKPDSPLEYYKLFVYFYKKKNFVEHAKRIYKSALQKPNLPQDFVESALEELGLKKY